ncbi:indolepyruvate ferredoxin oxidoreductase subunit alpha [Candidatus Bathyarchaeota archaeon]|nr:indolepyruvate ferredoxin oxidoreductase subunit alpha [Candidatus Bathyarchaeota archaeon]
MTFSDIVDPSPKTAFLMTNVAIARAALEADVKVAAFYPGSPTSEILDSMYLLSQDYKDLIMEVSSNEKVALETVAGASMAGARGFTSMKSVGLNVASDSYYTLGYTGVNAGLVAVVADDPHAHSSQSEQDGRYFAPTGHVPMLEPSTPQEAYDMTRYAFNLSERHRVLVLIRTTTRVNHQSAAVKVGEVKRTPFVKRRWEEVAAKYYTLSDTARRLKGEALDKLKLIEEEFEASPFNEAHQGTGKTGIITNGVSHLHVMEACHRLGVDPPTLKLGTLHPLPRKTISKFLGRLDRVVVVEELMPYLEDSVTAIAKDATPDVEMLGKRSGLLGFVGEYNAAIVTQTLAKVFGKEAPDYEGILARAAELKSILPVRKPTFCPGCPHRGTMWSVQQALKGMKYVVNNDIGCYSMLLLEPYGITDTLLDMGASQGISGGMQHILEDRVISFLGDSTFFHAALPGIVNAVHNRHDYTVFILDNSVTAMTGQQPNPGSDWGARDVVELDIEAVVRGIGVKNVTVINAFDPKPNVEKIKEAIMKPGVSVVISKGPCALYNDRVKRRNRVPITPNEVNTEECKTVYACIREFYCPAISVDQKTRQASIDVAQCNGCGNCGRLCPRTAIHTTGGDAK